MNDDQLRELLRSRDPASELPPLDAEPTTRLLEHAMSHDIRTPVHEPRPGHDPETDPRRRTPLTWLLAAAAVLVIAGVGVFGILRSSPDDRPSEQAREPASSSQPDDSQASVLELAAPAPTQGRCALPSAKVLAVQTVAFEGTVTEIDGDRVTLTVSHWYRGGEAAQVTVEAPPDRMQALIQAVTFEAGGRYLVSAHDGVVTVCGLSATYSEELADLYSEAFGA